MPTFDPIRRFLVVPAASDGLTVEPELPAGVTNWVGNLVTPEVYVIMTTDEIPDPPRAGIDFDPLQKAREIRDATPAQLRELLAIRMNNDASDGELAVVQDEMGVVAGQRLTRVDLNSWRVKGQ